MSEKRQRGREGNELLHYAGDDTSLRDGYHYGADGTGVRSDLVQAVIDAWSSLSSTSDPASPLRNVSDGTIHSVDNLARLAAAAVARTIAPRRP